MKHLITIIRRSTIRIQNITLPFRSNLTVLLEDFMMKGVNKLMPKELPKPVGRWNNEYCDVKTNKKVDFSNEDHCGPCGQYILPTEEPANKSSDNLDKK